MSMYLTFFAVLLGILLTLNPYGVLEKVPFLLAYKLPFSVVAAMLLVLARTKLTATGAFEISIDGELVHSKLASGKMPTLEMILAEIKRRQ